MTGPAPTRVTPGSIEELATLLRKASQESSAVQVVGGGTRQGYGSPKPPSLILDMSGFSGIEEWDPDDLTVTAGAGTRVADLEAELDEKAQTAVLPEVAGQSTIGGVVSAGASSLRRWRLLGTRERMLEVKLVTGDGRVIRAGGRVVKNVTGYDLPRLVVGAFGSMGVIVSVCLKLWPRPPAAATITIPDLEVASRVTRPLAVLEENEKSRIFLWGTYTEVEAITDRLDGEVAEGLDWPPDPDGAFRWSLRVPPASTAAAIQRLPGSWRYLAIHGVGEIRAASEKLDGAEEIRTWAEGLGGSLVVVSAPSGGLDGLDPWGKPPPALDVQRRLISQFDPARIINPGRLPAGL
jgi:glycolate oxidase FAD binding subunit